MTPQLPADLTPLPTLLAEPLAEAYRSALARKFVGTTVEDWLVVRRLLESGWTLAMVTEAILGARDGAGDGLRDVAEVLEGA